MPNKRAQLLLILASGIICLQPNPASAEMSLGFFLGKDLQQKLGSTLQLKVEETSYPLTFKKIASWKIKNVKDLDRQSEAENIYYCRESYEEINLCNLTELFTEKDHIIKGAEVFVHPDKIAAHLSSINEEVKKDPINGKLRMDPDSLTLKVITKSQNGYSLDEETSLNKITDELSRDSEKNEFSLAVNIIEPDIATDKVDEIEIDSLLGHGQSNFVGSPKNRVHNINVATRQFDGVLLAPDEEFSFVEILGPVEKETGYKEELVIKKNVVKTIPEFGGGVCQVSTTVFRAALNSGLPITERRNHAYPVQYYAPQGTDATIYIPSPDLKFVNDTEEYLLIQPSLSGTILSFDFYGKSDGRKVELEGPIVTERTPEGRLKTLLTQKVYDQNGELIREKDFKSSYDNPDNYH